MSSFHQFEVPGFHPAGEVLLKVVGIQQTQDSVKRVVRGYTARQLPKCSKPVFFFLPKLFHILPSVSVGDNDTGRYNKYVCEVMLTGRGAHLRGLR